jgi:hypothetical protein
VPVASSWQWCAVTRPGLYSGRKFEVAVGRGGTQRPPEAASLPLADPQVKEKYRPRKRMRSEVAEFLEQRFLHSRARNLDELSDADSSPIE